MPEHYEDALTSPEQSTRWLFANQLAPEGTQLLPYYQLQLTGLRIQSIAQLVEHAMAPMDDDAAGLLTGQGIGHALPVH